MAYAPPPVHAIAPAEECRKCRYARALARAAVFIPAGMLLSFMVSWVVSIAPVVGVLLGVLSLLLFARALLLAFVRPSLLVALAHLGASVGIGLLVSAAVGLLVA